jgi:predicted  nucleic acid-binding Zn-ribbon protein
MMTQEQLDLEIKKMRLEHEISSNQTALIDVKRKLLEMKKNEVAFNEQKRKYEEQIERLTNELCELS